MSGPSETRLQAYILAQISQEPRCAVLTPDGKLHGDANAEAIFWRQNTGAARTNDRLIRFGIIGQADITGVVRGRRVEVELKSETGQQTPAQQTFARLLEQAGGVYILARTRDDVLSPVRQLLLS